MPSWRLAIVFILPLQVNTKLGQEIAARNVIGVLQVATILTLIAMLLTLVWTALGVLLPHWRALENPQIPPDDVLSH